MKKSKFDKYLYYENSVQTPEEHVKIFDRMFWDQRGREALSLREDFCGTFLISCEWVRSHPKRTSIGVDLDPEPIRYGKTHGFKKIAPAARKRIKILQQDVCKVVAEKVDLIGAGNFSFNIFKERAQLKKYFQAALRSLNREGILVLELAGGPGFMKLGKEQKTYTVKNIGKYTYYWDQRVYDPVNHHALYTISFKTPDGKLHKDCFVYDWRVWTIPEIKDLMIEAGFKDTKVYWEACDKDGEGTGEYIEMKSGDNAYSWIAFVVGIK